MKKMLNIGSGGNFWTTQEVSYMSGELDWIEEGFQYEYSPNGLRIKTMMFKIKTKKSYKQIAEEAGIPYSCFAKFTSGSRPLAERNRDKLIRYLYAFEKKQKQK